MSRRFVSSADNTRLPYLLVKIAALISCCFQICNSRKFEVPVVSTQCFGETVLRMPVQAVLENGLHERRGRIRPEQGGGEGIRRGSPAEEVLPTGKMLTPREPNPGPSVDVCNLRTEKARRTLKWASASSRSTLPWSTRGTPSDATDSCPCRPSTFWCLTLCQNRIGSGSTYMIR